MFEREGLTSCDPLSKAELETVARSSTGTEAKLIEALTFIKLKHLKINMYPVKL